MEVRRYRKNWHRRPEKVDSSVFVAFWADDKYVSALDVDGVEWMLTGDHALKLIEAGDQGLVRIHRASLVRVAAIESLSARNERRTKPRAVTRDYFCQVGGREFPISRKCKKATYTRHGEFHAAQGNAQQVAA
ncbi:MAG: hypothetical protein K0S85_63 [Pseudomonas orientalis]|nr:hypothetical protein [Pseudomonas orientalis]